MPQLDPTQLRTLLFDAAASGTKHKLLQACRTYKDQAVRHVDFLTRLPDEFPRDDASIDRHIEQLFAIARCLANECGAPELLNKLSTVKEDNPFTRWDGWLEQVAARIQRLEYESLINEAEDGIAEIRQFAGATARQYEAMFVGRMGELVFHSGRVAESMSRFRSAYELCTGIGDIEGQDVYLTYLLECHCYLADGSEVAAATELRDFKEKLGHPTKEIERRLQRLRVGEPLNRVVCVSTRGEEELDELVDATADRYQFQFRRNRISLQKATTLTRLGNQLATEGNLADALERYDQASEVDPFDPDPVYQRGMCLLEMGLYAQARDAYAEVEQLAPGWFRCRSDHWLADGLDRGTISVEEFQLLRALDDGRLPRAQAEKLAREGQARFPEFAPLYLFLGDLGASQEEAQAAYRKGLECVREPDLESRLLCGLAASSTERSVELESWLDRIDSLPGSLVAKATARVIRARAMG
ncbi:MAG: tetratricopeptide repeat protein [Planctomycetales bacterium]|nr:tetratricopeptide repeat protein [Planctomycetales bacterium]